MFAVTDLQFGMALLVVLIVACVIYALRAPTDVPAPEFTVQKHCRLVGPPPFFDWAVDDDELGPDLTPAHGRDRPSLHDWLGAETG